MKIEGNYSAGQVRRVSHKSIKSTPKKVTPSEPKDTVDPLSSTAADLSQISSNLSRVASTISPKASKTYYPYREGNYAEALTDGSQILDKIQKTIEKAKDLVQVQMYRLGHDKIVDVLADQARKGVKVQVLLDPTPGYDKHDAKEQAQIQNYLRTNGVEILKYPIDGPSGKIDHIKMLIVDGKSLLIGGMNWDKHSPINQDMDVYIEGPVVGDAMDVFNHDWKLAGGEVIPGFKKPEKHKKANATIRMLTTEVDRKDINTALQQNIKAAKKSIRMEAFALADKETIKNLIDAKNRGVDVRVILDPNPPIFYVNKKTAKTLREAGIPVRWFNVDVDKKQKLHAKMALFDDDKVIIGSANFTHAGLSINHEADVEVISKAVGTAFTKMFDEHWENYAVEEAPVLPDFNEKVGDAPFKEQLAKDVYTYFTKTYHTKRRNWVGKRKAVVLKAIKEYDKTEQPAPLDIIKGAMDNPTDEVQEMKVIGDLASFFGDIKEFKMDPAPGTYKSIYDRRVEISEKRADEVAKSVPRYIKDMINAIQDKEIRDFVKMAFEKAPKGFFKAPSSASGKYHPADECDPSNVNLSPTKPAKEYKGGGLVLHSRRDQFMAEKLCQHYGITGKEKDEILAAMALHDIMKGVTMEDMKKAMAEGKEIPWKHTTTPEHGAVAAEWIKMLDPSPDKKLTENIRKLVRDHMGIWNEPVPTPPRDVKSFIVSMADYIVSQRNVYLDV